MSLRITTGSCVSKSMPSLSTFICRIVCAPPREDGPFAAHFCGSYRMARGAAGFPTLLLLRLRVTPEAFYQPQFRALAGQIEGTIVTIVAAFLIWRIAVALTDRFFARRFVSHYLPRVATFCTLMKSLTGIIIVVIGGLELL